MSKTMVDTNDDEPRTRPSAGVAGVRVATVRPAS